MSNAMNRAIALAELHDWTFQARPGDWEDTTRVVFQRGDEQIDSEWITKTGQFDWAEYVGPHGVIVRCEHAWIARKLLRSIPAV